MISGFQNYLHLALGLPNGWAPRGTSDGFIPDTGRIARKAKRKRKADDLHAELSSLLNERSSEPAAKQKLQRLLMLVMDLDD